MLLKFFPPAPNMHLLQEILQNFIQSLAFFNKGVEFDD